MIRKRAFTLIELLVVIAIIAMLLAILVPVLKKAKAQARDLIDRTNLRSLGMAGDLYLTQNKEKLFAYPKGTNYLWLLKIGDMIDNIDDIRFCPKTIAKISEVEQDYAVAGGHKQGTSDKPWLWQLSPGNYEMGSYGLNGWLYAAVADPADMPWVANPADIDKPFSKRTEVRMPSQTPLFLDSNWVDGWPKNDNVLPATAKPAPGGTYDYDTGLWTSGNSSGTTMMGRFVLGRHGPETNVVFLDAHAETIPHAKLWALGWHRGSKPIFNPVIPKPIPSKN